MASKIDTPTQDAKMYISQPYGLWTLVLVMLGVGGCTDGGSSAFRSSNRSDFPALVAEASSIQQSALDVVEKDSTQATLVSKTVTNDSASPSLITLATHEDLDAKISGASGTVILDFYADWCGPCRTQGKILHDLESTAAASDTLIIKINVDDHPKLAKKYGVTGLPTLMVVTNGKVIARQTGIADKNQIQTWMR